MGTRPPRPLLQQMRHLLKSGAIREPLWYEPLCSVPPEDPNPRVPKPPVIKYPEDHLVREYRIKNPQAYKIPLNMLSDDMHVIRKFAIYQHELMESGYSKEEAYQRAQVKFKEEIVAASTPFPGGANLESMQAAEDMYVKAALSHVPVKRPEPVKAIEEIEDESESGKKKKKQQSPVEKKKKK